jgi:succinate dehydrogenase/fumarate reductase flavoprotein subunit
MLEEIRTDVLVAGGGMAGLMAATRAHAAGARVALLTAVPGASIRMAGFSTALGDAPEDRLDALFNDMFIAGGFLNHPTLLAAVAERIGPETRFLEELGVPFHRQAGTLSRRQAAGVTWRRAVFTLDMVGLDAGKRLVERLRAASPTVRVLDGGVLVDLDAHDGVIHGGLAYLTPDKRWVRIAASAVVLATGGAGQLFAHTTNFTGSQGTGYALALEAGAPLRDMEFVSYEPTVSVAPARIVGMELPTMAFSEGARLLNGRGDEFISTNPPPGKDVMCRAMLREVREGRGTTDGAILYDLRQMTPEAALGYSQIRRVLKALNLTPGEAQIEIMPTQHFVMGGVGTDENGASAVAGLYAVGEVAGGAHGAHRLATCGGTEAIAMGAIAGECAAQYACGREPRPMGRTSQARPEGLPGPLDSADTVRLAAIRDALEQGCGVLREAGSLRRSLAALDAVREELHALGGMQTHVGRAALVASAIALAALTRTESRGDHFRTDYPNRDDRRWLGNLVAVLKRDRAGVELSFVQAGIGARTAASVPEAGPCTPNVRRPGRPPVPDAP